MVKGCMGWEGAHSGSGLVAKRGTSAVEVYVLIPHICRVRAVAAAQGIFCDLCIPKLFVKKNNKMFL